MALSLRLSIFVLLLTVAACQPAQNTVPPPSVPIGEVTRPDLVETIQWDRSPATVVFRAEVAGGSVTNPFITRNDVPFCSIYGDNRVVWTITTLRNDDTVVYDVVSDEVIRLFVEELTAVRNIYDYKTGADLLVPSEVEPVVERLTLFVNGNLHQTDSFGGWDYTYFQQIVERCRNISTTPVQFAPEAAWVSAQRTEYDPSRPSLLWDGDAAELPLAQLADTGEPRWVEGRNVLVLWDRIRNAGTDVQFEDNGETFLIAVEVPNITSAAPPVP